MYTKYLTTIIVFYFFSACILNVHNVSFELNNNILANDFLYEFDKNEYPDVLSLNLKKKINCDLELQFYRMAKDSLVKGRAIKLRDLRVQQPFLMDWYSQTLLIKVIDAEWKDCEDLELDIGVTYSIFD